MTTGENATETGVVPRWIDSSFNETIGRDPFGVVTITQDRLMPRLLPDLVALAERARYFSFYALLLRRYEERGLLATSAALGKFIRLREWDYAAAVRLCDKPHCGERAQAIIGRLKTFPATAQAQAAGQMMLRRQVPMESPLGGYGLNYRAPLIDLGAAWPAGSVRTGKDGGASRVDVLSDHPLAQELSESLREHIASTVWYREYLDRDGEIEVPLAVLRELSTAACLCRLDESPRERAAIRRLVLETESVRERGALQQRRMSFAFFLSLLERDERAATSRGWFERSTLAALDDAVASDPSSQDAIVAAQWSGLALKEHLQEALSGIFGQLCRDGYQQCPVAGWNGPEVEHFVRTVLVGSDELQLPRAGTLAISAAMPTRVLQGRLLAAATDLDLEDLRAWAELKNDAISGLALLLVLERRLPEPPGLAGRALAEIAAVDSGHAAGLSNRIQFLRAHLDQEPTLGDTMWWIARDLIETHVRIAYGKLGQGDFTFRWVREEGRLSFTGLAGKHMRIERATNRQRAMWLLSRDLGLARPTDAGGRVTSDGLALADDALAK